MVNWNVLQTVDDQTVNLQIAAPKLRDYERTVIMEQISSQGLGSELVIEMLHSHNQQEVNVDNLLNWLFIQRQGFNFIEFLAGKFSAVELLEQVSDYFKFKIPKDGKTIGFLFGQIESNKEKLTIQEYGVSQTSLE